jgi:hypothetical protein
MEKLRAAIVAASDLLYRAKGFVPTPEGGVQIDYAAGRFDATPSVEQTTGGLVLIARGEEQERFAAWLAALRNEVGAAPAGSVSAKAEEAQPEGVSSYG